MKGRLRTRTSVVAILLVALAGIMSFAFTSSAKASATGTIVVCAVDSTGTPIAPTDITGYWQQGAYSHFVGPAGVSGCRESTVPAGSVTVWVEKNFSYSEHQTGIVPDGGTVPFTFYTTKVTLEYSHQIAMGGPNGTYTYFKSFASPSVNSRELFSDGTTPLQFALYQTGGANGHTSLVWPVATGPGATYARSFMVLRLLDSTGNPLAGGTARYQYGYWHYAPGSTGADGLLSYSVPGLAGDVTNQMRYDNTTQTKTQNVATDSVFTFQTRLVTLRLESSTGTGLDGGHARYGIGSKYWTWWFPGGVTGSSATGETAAQMFPGTYSFEMQYMGTADRKLDVVIPDSDTTLVWATTAVTLHYSGPVSYGGGSGDARWFGKPTMELLPGTYWFHFRDAYGGVHVQLTWGSTAYEKSMIITHLLDSGNNGLPGGVVSYAPGGSWLSLGTTDADGLAYLLVDGALGNIQVRVGYHNGSEIQYYSQPSHSVFVFQTVDATIRLIDSNSDPLEGGFVQQGGGSWIDVGTTDASGNVTFPVFPGSYKFKMTYNYGSEEMTQNISTPVVFQTGAVHSDSGYATQYAQGSWHPFYDGVELLPGSWHFSFSDGTPITYYTIVGGTVNDIY